MFKPKERVFEVNLDYSDTIAFNNFKTYVLFNNINCNLNKAEDMFKNNIKNMFTFIKNMNYEEAIKLCQNYGVDGL